MKKKLLSIPVAAVLAILVLVLLDLVGGILHLTLLPWYKWIPTFLFVVALALICANYPLPDDGTKLTFSTVFKYGLKVSALAAAFMTVYSFISMSFIFPEMKEQALDVARKEMEAKGSLTQEQIDAGINMTRNLFVPFALVGSLLGTFIIGLIGSLIGAGVASNKKANVGDAFSQ